MLDRENKEHILLYLYNNFAKEHPFPRSQDGKQEASWQEILIWEGKRFRYVENNMHKIEQQYLKEEKNR